MFLFAQYHPIDMREGFEINPHKKKIYKFQTVMGFDLQQPKKQSRVRA
jgi:hypothetical protein